MTKINTTFVSNTFFKQFDPDNKFGECELFTKMKSDLAKLLDVNTFEKYDLDSCKLMVSDFFNKYKDLDKFMNCHLKDDMANEMLAMFNDFENYTNNLIKENTVMKIKFDEKIFVVDNDANNIVEVAEKNGVYIPAPCFRNKKSKGCCNGCLIMINGEKGFACNTKPEDGMEIVYDREDLASKRKENLMKYSNAIKSGDLSQNTCSTGGCGSSSSKPLSITTSGCGCSSNSCC